MRLRDLPIKAVYKSERDNILRDFYIPALSCSVSYDRAVGFFSASMLSYAAQGLESFIRSGGKMRLIVGAELDPDEHDAALKGYEERARLIELLGKEFSPVLTQVTQELFLKRLAALQWLISNNRLDVKVALRRRGMYHEKVGVLRDGTGDFIVFQGSANESLYALNPDFNYESINVFKSWKESDREHYEAHLDSFTELWEGQSKTTLVIDLPELAKNALLSRMIPKRQDDRSELEIADSLFAGKNAQVRVGPRPPEGFTLFEHQRNALTEWKNQDFTGIFNLATGAGKTLMAISGGVRVLENTHRLFMLVAVPYQTLAEQWLSELRKFRINGLLCSSASSTWQQELATGVDQFRIGRLDFAAAVVVNKTLTSDAFQRLIRKIPRDEFLFIGDECHYHGTPRLFAALPENARLRMGLSATYERHGDQEGTARLEAYYGTVVSNFGLDKAIDAGFLVPYEYHLELVSLNDREAEEYLQISEQISAKLAALGKKNAEAVSDPFLSRLLFARARLLGRIESKGQRLAEIIDASGISSRTLIYCGDGAAADFEEDDDELRDDEKLHIDLITKMISSRGYRVNKFTAREGICERQAILDGFKNGTIQVLTAIRCLDEGVDIPVCDTAFILASSKNPRQFIQRRGRILRRSPGKRMARLWDFLPLLPESLVNAEVHERNLLRSELGRIGEFARHSRNYRETYEKLQEKLDVYDLGADFVLASL